MAEEVHNPGMRATPLGNHGVASSAQRFFFLPRPPMLSGQRSRARRKATPRSFWQCSMSSRKTERSAAPSLAACKAKVSVTSGDRRTACVLRRRSAHHRLSPHQSPSPPAPRGSARGSRHQLSPTLGLRAGSLMSNRVRCWLPSARGRLAAASGARASMAGELRCPTGAYR